MNYRETRLFLLVVALILGAFFSTVGAILFYKNLSATVAQIK